jgi:hypothetical protein
VNDSSNAILGCKRMQPMYVIYIANNDLTALLGPSYSVDRNYLRALGFKLMPHDIAYQACSAGNEDGSIGRKLAHKLSSALCQQDIS